jgi:peptidoglycan/xylan/chitin deacetylase (PgdA/CDA1 family)
VKLAIKIDVDTYRGTREGVPRLVRLLQLHEVKATFLFSLGPDHTGRAIRRAFRPGFFSKVKRTSVLEHYGLKTLLYGTLLAGPDIGRRCRDEMRAVKAAGFEVGVHCWDHARWQDNVTGKGADWTEREMQRAFLRFEEIFAEKPQIWGAAGWQMNRHAAWFEELHCRYASDTRGREPFRPLWDGVAIGCPQLPTTLPTLDEIVGVHEDAASHILGLTANPANHVFTAHAELEGGNWHGIFDRLLAGWRDQGYELVSLKSLYESLDPAALPKCEVVQGTLPGRSGTLAVQA